MFCLRLRCVSTSHSSAHLLYLVVVVENFSQLFFFLVSSPKQCPAHQEFFSSILYFAFVYIYAVMYLFCQSGKFFSVTWTSSARIRAGWFGVRSQKVTAFGKLWAVTVIWPLGYLDIPWLNPLYCRPLNVCVEPHIQVLLT